MINMIDNFYLATTEEHGKLEFVFAYLVDGPEDSEIDNLYVIKLFDDLVPAIDYGIDYILDLNQKDPALPPSEIRDMITWMTRIKDLWNKNREIYLNTPDCYLVLKAVLSMDHIVVDGLFDKEGQK